MADVATANFFARAFERTRLASLSDWLAVGVAVSFPWSTTVNELFIVLWLFALLPTLSFADIRRELLTAAGGLPALLWLAGVLGMLWADVSFAERIAGLGGYNKLLVIPLLLAQFRRSGRAIPVLYGFVASCTALMIVSWVLKLDWDLRGFDSFYVHNKLPGVPFRDYNAQSSEFLGCSLGLLAIALEAAQARRFAPALGLAALALAFIANILYVAPGRTGLIVGAILTLVLGARYFGWKGVFGAMLIGALVAGAAWASSPLLRARVTHTFVEIRSYSTENAVTSAGARLEFWKKSIDFVADAPLFGNGTGSMPDLYRRAAAGESGAEGVATVNPHNQYVAVAIELGLFGLAIMIAMWVAHYMLFRGPDLLSWFGLVMVLQNVIEAAFNSHLFDSFHGWLYVFAVGVLGGAVLHRAAPPRATGGAI